MKLGLVAVALLMACGDDGSDAEAVDESLACPPELTYAKVGESFLEAHCLVCHSAVNAEKLGDGNVIDSNARIREHGKYLYDLVLSGEMPKSGAAVPEAEKRDFLDWMECSGAAASNPAHMH